MREELQDTSPSRKDTTVLAECIRRAYDNRSALFSNPETNLFRVVHGAADGLPGVYADLLVNHLYVRLKGPQDQEALLQALVEEYRPRAVYVQETEEKKTAVRVYGAPGEITVLGLENQLTYVLKPLEPFSFGLFLDQREARKDFMRLKNDCRVLNLFSYTCGFSVAAASHGAQTTSVDLSQKFLDWGRENFRINHIDDQRHEFFESDTFDCLKRFAKKGRQFDVIAIDPPTFSRNHQGEVFQVKKHLTQLVTEAAALLAPGGLLFVSQNSQTFLRKDFKESVLKGLKEADKEVEKVTLASVPVDFPDSPEEPPPSQAFWIKIHA